MEEILATSLRVVALAVALCVCFALGSGIAMRGVVQPASNGAGNAALTLLLVCVLETLVMSYLILRSRWSGWRLVVTVFFVFYGVTTFMPQTESAVFLTKLPSGMVPRLFLMGFLIAAPFSIIAVWILGRWKPALETHSMRLEMPPGEWTWKLAVIAIAYVVLYFTFGYFIAWRTPAVREYYGGSDPGNFFAQMQSVMRDTPWLVPFQIFRALCWVAIAVPIVKMLKGGRLEILLALAFTFGVVMNAQLLLPNPYMPEPVRMAHLVETASSNFLFGLLVGWLLTYRPAARVYKTATTVFH